MVYNVDLRVEKGGISIKQIADHLGMHRMTVSFWFNKSEMDEVKRGIVLKAIKEIQVAELQKGQK